MNSIIILISSSFIFVRSSFASAPTSPSTTTLCRNARDAYLARGANASQTHDSLFGRTLTIPEPNEILSEWYHEDAPVISTTSTVTVFETPELYHEDAPVISTTSTVIVFETPEVYHEDAPVISTTTTTTVFETPTDIPSPIVEAPNDNTKAHITKGVTTTLAAEVSWRTKTTYIVGGGYSGGVHHDDTSSSGTDSDTDEMDHHEPTNGEPPVLYASDEELEDDTLGPKCPNKNAAPDFSYPKVTTMALTCWFAVAAGFFLFG